MIYENIQPAYFVSRPNRFIAEVRLAGPEGPQGEILRVHVKNTGRCRELLKEGSRVILSRAANPNRKTAYDLIGVYREDGPFFNIDSQAANQVTGEWLRDLNYFDEIRPEYRIGNSRIDFWMKRGDQPYLLEVKGCTLVREGIGYFPDAPTERGIKHLKELAGLAGQGYKCAVGFVIQTEGVTKVLPNMETHPAFGQALKEAEEAGVNVLYLPCRVGEDFLRIDEKTLWPDQKIMEE